MGVYVRRDSPYYWLLLERKHQKPLRQPTKIWVRTDTPEQTKENRRTAESAYHAAMLDLAKGTLALPQSTAIGKRFTEFAQWYQTHELPKHRGAEREAEILPRLIAFFGAYTLRAITKARVSEYETHRLGQRVTPSTVNREVDLLKTIMRLAGEQKLVPEGQIAGKKRLHVTKPIKVRLTPADERKILKHLTHPGDKALFLMGLDTLARLGDILDFRTHHDHGKTLTIVDPKNGRPVSVPVSTRLRKALDRVEPQKGYYFWHRRQAKKSRDWRSSVKQMLELACERAGVAYGRVNHAITFHAATRRTGASRMLARGADLETVRSIGGWLDLRSVQGYLVPEEGNRRKAVELVGPNHASLTKRGKSSRKN